MVDAPFFWWMRRNCGGYSDASAYRDAHLQSDCKVLERVASMSCQGQLVPGPSLPSGIDFERLAPLSHSCTKENRLVWSLEHVPPRPGSVDSLLFRVDNKHE